MATIIFGLGRAGVVRGVPGGKPSAGSVFRKLQAAGLSIENGEPEAARFRDIVHDNNCAQSRGFVRSESDKGWALICVGMPRQAFKRLAAKNESVPSLLGPLYADAFDGDVVIIGFGWPDDFSERVSNALGDPEGNYLGPSET